MSRKYNPTDSLIYKDIDVDSDKKVVFLSGLGLEIRQQREGFIRRFALNSGVSYLALDYTRYLETNPENIENAFSRTMEILSNISKNKKLFLSGPCFGGVMALRAASKIPERVGGVITISPAYETESFPWIEKAGQFLDQKIARLKKKNIDNKIVKKMISFRELVIKAFNRHGKEKIEATYQGPLSIFHAEKDNLIPVENSTYVQAALNNPNTSLYIVANTGHTLSNDFKMKAQTKILKEQLERI